MSESPQQYRPGDVVNGHRLSENGTWEPLPVHAQQPKQKKPFYKRWWVITLAVLFILGAFGAIGGNSDDTATTAKDEPSTSQTSAADQPAADDTPSSASSSSSSSTTTTAPSPSSTTTKATPKPKPTHKLTAGEEQAIGAAQDYLDFQPFSRKGLIQQLHSDAGSGFSLHDATYAVDHIKVNWNEQAAKAAKQYLEMMHFSRSGLIQQLESSAGSGFTHAQAVYGVKKAGL